MNDYNDEYKSPFEDKRIVFIYIIVICAILTSVTYALQTTSIAFNLTTGIVMLDEDAYGDTTFDSSDIDMVPILDSEVETRLDNVIKIDFTVGGNEANNVETIIYDIALVDLNLDCALLSEYFKWKLVKDGEEIAIGSFSYTFDTIKNGRLVLTNPQFDLPKYNETELGYHDYSFYIWLSDSCQDELATCKANGNIIDQSDLMGKYFSGKIEVELYTESKKDLVRTPVDTLPEGTCNVSRDFVETIMKPNAISDKDIDFSQTSGESGTNGIYLRSGTENDSNPIYYYRGNVDNNLIFADFCWKIVRTTETGGLKLIYNGTPTYETNYESINTLNSSDYNTTTVTDFSFDSSTSTWSSTNRDDNSTGTIEFTVATAGDYIMSYEVSSDDNNIEVVVYKNEEIIDYYYDTGQVVLSGITTSDVIKIEVYKWSSSSSGIDKFSFSLGVGVGEKTVGPLCNNAEAASTIGNKQFNSSYNSPAYVGYMYGTVYTRSTKLMWDITDTYYYGNDVSYADGTYTLTDTITSSDWSSIYSSGLNNYHYTCFSTGTTCTSVYYIYYTDSSTAYYITLTDGKKVEDALSEMLDNNTTSSTIKGNNTTSGTLDYWYYTNIDQKGYNSYVEDTIWCNDRSIYQKNGWDPNGGDTTSEYLDFSVANRASTIYEPDLTCAREIDKFTVDEKNGNGDLDYPVGLLTADEIMLAGAKHVTQDSSHYLYNGITYWTVSPYNFNHDYALMFNLYYLGFLYDNHVSDFENSGVRPSISLKSGFSLTDGGDGTVENPYVVE